MTIILNHAHLQTPRVIHLYVQLNIPAQAILSFIVYIVCLMYFAFLSNLHFGFKRF